MIVYREHPVSKVSPFIVTGHGGISLSNQFVGTSSSRLLILKRDKFICVGCGRIGNVFRVEKHHVSDNKAHLNLYYVPPEHNKYILMTKDHIIPKSLGGRNVIHNYQTMCTKCNNKKSNTCYLPVLYGSNVITI